MRIIFKRILQKVITDNLKQFIESQTTTVSMPMAGESSACMLWLYFMELSDEAERFYTETLAYEEEE